jgi:hypothetical protein
VRSASGKLAPLITKLIAVIQRQSEALKYYSGGDENIKARWPEPIGTTATEAQADVIELLKETK